MTEFAKGIWLKNHDYKNKEGKAWNVIKMGICKELFLQNFFNKNGWANFEIRTSATGEPYAVVDMSENVIKSTYSKPKTESNNIDDEEIPF